MPKRESLTPSDASLLLERISPVQLKLGLQEILEWQAQKGKRLVGLRWYLERLRYTLEPRSKKAHADNRQQVAQLVKQAGG